MKPWRAALTSATASGKSTRIASRSAIACSSGLPDDLELRERRRAELDRGVQRQGRELLALGLLHRLGLLLGELAQSAEEILGIAAEREAERTTFHDMHPTAAAAGGGSRPRRRTPRRHRAWARERARERRGVLAERPLEPPRRLADPVEVAGRGDPGRSTERPARARPRPQRPRRRRPARRAAPPSASRRRELRRGRRASASSTASSQRTTIEATSRTRSRSSTRRRAGRRATSHSRASLLAECDEVGALARRRSRRRARPRHGPKRRRGRGGALELARRGSRRQHASPRVGASARARRRLARAVDSPAVSTRRTGQAALRAARADLRPHRRAALLRAGPALARLPRLADRGRHRRAASSTSRPGPGPSPASSAAATAARVVGLDQSPEMLAEARRRLGDEVELVEGEADRLPFADGAFDALTLHLPAALRRRPARDAARARPGRPPRRRHRRARVRPARRALAGRSGSSTSAPCCPRPGRWSAAAGARPGASSAPRSAASTSAGRRSGCSRPGAAAGIGEAAPAADVARRRGGDMGTEAPRPAFYALRAGGWRDYVTVLHLPYTAWNLAYVALGAALAPHFHTDRMLWTMAAFALGLGVSAHVLDELNGRPLGDRDPERRPGRARASPRSPAPARSASGRRSAGATALLGVRRGRGIHRPRLQPRVVRRPLPRRLVARARLGRAARAQRLLRPGRRPAPRRPSSPPATRPR